MDGSKFCRRCHDAFMEEFNKRHGGDPSFVLDTRYMVYGCKIPKFSISQTGRMVVSFWDCEKKTIVEFSQEEYIQKKNRGELP